MDIEPPASRLKRAAYRALRRALRPLVRIALRVGLPATDFTELAKEAYFDCARLDYGLRGRPTNLSRVAILTGLSRRECTRLKRSFERRTRQDTQLTLSPMARLMSVWSTDPRYSDASGPKVLRREGPGVSLAALLAETSGDLPEGALLKELDRVGALEPADAQSVRLAQRSFVPPGLNEEKLRIAANQFADLGATVVSNLDSERSARLQRYVVNDRVPARLVEAFQARATELGQRLLEDLDVWLAEHELAEDSVEDGVRTGLGVYFFTGESGSGSTGAE